MDCIEVLSVKYGDFCKLDRLDIVIRMLENGASMFVQ